MPTSPESDESSIDARPGEGYAAPESETAETGDTSPDAELAQLRAQLAATEDRHRRARADLDNYRKRVEREGDRRATAALHGLLREWLDVRDSVELALHHQPGDGGLIAVLGQIDTILGRHRVEQMQPVGQPFDPNRFEAVGVQADNDVADRTVLAVVRSGFELADGEVLRPAAVVVSRREPTPAGGT